MNWMEAKIRRASAMRLFLAIAVLVIVAGMLAANARYFRNFFKGPYAIPVAELKAAPSAKDLPRYWVTVTADKIVETGFQEITIHKKHGVERSREVSASYHVAALGDRLLLVKSHRDTPSVALIGYLKPVAEPVDEKFFLSPDIVEIRSKFLPMMLDTGDFEGDGQFGLVVAGLLSLAALVFGFMAWGRYRNPGAHPVIRNSRNWGAPDDVSATIQAELVSGKTLKMGGYVFTPTFLVRDELLNFEVLRLDEVLWAYKHVLAKKLYYVIPAGKTFSVRLNWLNHNVTVNGKEADVGAVLQYFTNYLPWTLVGYSDELAAAYKKKRSELASVVAQRRNEVSQAAR